MEEFQEKTEETREGYIPRPSWQVWMARLGLVVFIGIVIAQILQIAMAGA